jgi:hypothetical protein
MSTLLEQRCNVSSYTIILFHHLIQKTTNFINGRLYYWHRLHIIIHVWVSNKRIMIWWLAGSAQILSDGRSHLKFLGIRIVRRSQSYTEDPQILRATMHNLAIWVTRYFVQQAGLHPFTQAWKLYGALRAVRTNLSGGRLGLAWLGVASTELHMFVAPMKKTSR